MYNYYKVDDIMKFISDINVDNKRVILRLDLNVTIKDNKIVDDTKIIKSLPTIDYLLEKNCSILIMSHLGKVKTLEDKRKNSLELVYNRLKDIYKDIKFSKSTRGEELENLLYNNRLVLMENTRFEDIDGKKESSCDEALSKYWSTLGSVLVNDAFGTTHRKHASNYGIAKYIDSCYGFLIKEELEGLSPVINNVEHPFAVIMGGAKVDDKIKLIRSLLDECDYLIVGGGIANSFIKASGINVGTSLYSVETLDEVKDILDKYSNKIIIPTDVVVKGENISCKNVKDILDDEAIYDIGNNSINSIKKIIDKSKTVFINGTVGLYEEEEFSNGTREVLSYITSSNIKSVAGGGDALASINKFGLSDQIDYISTGGGATLEYITDKKINCFEE